MALVFQIVLGLALVTALVCAILSSKIWHWTQVVLVTFIMLFGVGALFLGAEVFRIHRNLRSGIPNFEQRLEAEAQRTERLLNGSGEEPGIRELEHELQLVTRQRGRVWRQVQPAGEVSNQGAVTVKIPSPVPHGLDTDSIVYVFESGDPVQGAQYLGEFRVAGSTADGATLEPILLIDQRTGERLAGSGGPWTLFETMPSDRHNLYEGLTEEQLRELLPEESVAEYIHHGEEADVNDNPWHVIGFDAAGNRIDLDSGEAAEKKLYDRPLRDYAYLFEELARERVEARAQIQAIQGDIAKLEETLSSAEKLSQFRNQQIEALTSDVAGMRMDREKVEALRDRIQKGLSIAQQRIENLLAQNLSLARQLQRQQLQLIEEIDSRAPSPRDLGILSP